MPTTTAPPLDEVVAAMQVLADPGLPGEPWTAAEIADALPLLAEGPSPLPVEAETARWLCAADPAPAGD